MHAFLSSPKVNRLTPIELDEDRTKSTKKKKHTKHTTTTNEKHKPTTDYKTLKWLYRLRDIQ